MNIQTTFRHPVLDVIQIQFESTSGEWVSFDLNCKTGILSNFVNFAPSNQIPNWYTNTPFTNWRLIVPEGTLSFHQCTLTSHSPLLTEHQCTQLQNVFSPQVLCAIWLGKYGYSILRA